MHVLQIIFYGLTDLILSCIVVSAVIDGYNNMKSENKEKIRNDRAMNCISNNGGRWWITIKILNTVTFLKYFIVSFYNILKNKK